MVDAAKVVFCMLPDRVFSPESLVWILPRAVIVSLPSKHAIAWVCLARCVCSSLCWVVAFLFPSDSGLWETASMFVGRYALAIAMVPSGVVMVTAMELYFELRHMVGSFPGACDDSRVRRSIVFVLRSIIH